MSIRINEQQFPSGKLKNDIAQTQEVESVQPNPELKSIDTIPSSLLRGAYGVVPFSGINDKKVDDLPKNISFTANPLYDINLKKLMNADIYENIPAKFSELVLKNEDDGWTAVDIDYKWGDRTDYARAFADNFIRRKDENSYFVTEIANKKQELFDRITCLLETTNPKVTADRDVFEIKLLQASPSYANMAIPEIKGSGELALYGAVKVAQKNGFKKVKLFSTNNDFYDRVGFVKLETVYSGDNTPDGGVYELSSDMFDSFMRRIEKKYNLH